MEKELRATERSRRQSAVPTEPDIFGIIRHFGTGDVEHRWVWRAIWRHFSGQGVRLMSRPIKVLAYEAKGGVSRRILVRIVRISETQFLASFRGDGSDRPRLASDSMDTRL